jgi:molybdate transport system substrate-binding protein
MTQHSFRTLPVQAAIGFAIFVAALGLGMKPSAAADIHVYTSGAPSAVQKTIAGKFTKATGNHVAITAKTLRKVRTELAAAKDADVVVLPVPAMNAFDKQGMFRPGSRLNLARVGIGVVVRQGAPLPDISTPDALRKTLLKARSIAHPDPKGGGFAGAQVDRMFVKLGIADQVRPKVVFMYAYTGGVANIAKGKAEIGFFNISEIVPVKGVTLVGPLPAELQSYITFGGAVDARSKAPEVSAAFQRALANPSERDTWKGGGFELISATH